ncbi:hypothetical protein BD311DRAFT_52433 [Dichomitus squalens]|uniref:Uncharacterized protein n=1 Tax=Dichomitus squalens TaxID=114155 RepID=A0A4Q9MZJ1_9APHY|nr:hypothetical protein BD311DRAFT_52433 [Dichomitus squalens]
MIPQICLASRYPAVSRTWRCCAEALPRHCLVRARCVRFYHVATNSQSASGWLRQINFNDASGYEAIVCRDLELMSLMTALDLSDGEGPEARGPTSLTRHMRCSCARLVHQSPLVISQSATERWPCGPAMDVKIPERMAEPLGTVSSARI